MTRRSQKTGNSLAAALAAALVLAGMLSWTQYAIGAGGDILWQFGYNASSVQLTRGGVVDQADGSVIITGTSNNDYNTVKINAAGNDTLWFDTFDLAGGEDQANDVVLDSKGHVIVTGTAYNGNNNDIVTIKYCGKTYLPRPGLADDPEACNAGDVLWQAVFNGAANGHDHGVALAVDGLDNIYVGGKTQNLSGDFDYLLLRYNPTGPLVSGGPTWRKTYDGSGGDNDYVTDIAAITINGDSYIAVTGNIKNNEASPNLDIHTIKYDSGGQVLWSATVPTGTGGQDNAVAVNLTADGRVVVTGYLSLTSRDIYTVRYNLSGVADWEATYTTANVDEPADLALDSNGDIYITGRTFVTLQNYNFLTVRYTPPGTDPVWAKIYNSPSNDEDIAIAITVDPLITGGVFVTGTTKDNNTDFDFRTIKYEKGDGNELWNTVFDGAAGSRNDAPVAVDRLSADGAVYVMGYSDTYTDSNTDLDYYVIKYDAGLLDPPTNLVAAAVSETKIALTWADNTSDELGFEVHRSTVPFTISNDSLLAAVGAGVEAYNDSTVQAHTRYYYAIRAYTADDYSYSSNQATTVTTILNYPVPDWRYTYDSSHDAFYFNDRALAIAVGPDNNPVATGYNHDETNSDDYYTVKLNRVPLANDSIKVEWSDISDASGGQVDKAYGLVVDANGNVVVTGYGQIAQNNEIYTVKYPATGLYKCCDGWVDPPIWEDTYGGVGSDYPVKIILAPDGLTKAVAGHGNNGDNDIYLIKYNNSDGGGFNTNEPAWVSVYNTTGRHDYAADAAYDGDGNIIVTGRCNGDDVIGFGSFDMYTAKYNNSTGARIWTNCIDHSGGDDAGNSVVVDDNNDVYVTGYATINGTKDYYTVKYDGNTGAVVWQQPYNGPANGDDMAQTIRLDRNFGGGVVVGGTRLSSAGIHDFYILRYDFADGDVNMENILDREFDDDRFYTMEVDPSGNICAVGTTGSGDGIDIIGIKYGYDGQVLGSFRYGGTGNSLDEPTGIAVNTYGEIFIAGFVTNNAPTANNDYLVLKCPGDVLQAPSPFSLASYYHYTDLSWDPSHNAGTTTYDIERKQDFCTGTDDGNWLPVVTGFSGTSYTDYGPNDAGLEAGATYCFRIKSVQGGTSSRWLEQEIPTNSPPPPTSLTADSVFGDQINLAWQESINGETGFEIWRCAGAGCEDYSLIGTTGPGVQAFSDHTVCELSTYRYKVLGRNDQYHWESAWSTSVDETTIDAPYIDAPVTSLTASWSSEGRVDVDWNDANSSESGFTLSRCTGAGCSDFSVLANIELNPAVEAVAYWHLENFWAGAAGEVVDATGNGYHGTRSGDTHSGPGGRYGRAAYFDGSRDFITIVPGTRFLRYATNSSYSFAAWVKPAVVPPNTSTNDSRATILARNGNETALYYDHTGKFGFVITNSDNTSFTAISENTYPADSLHHVVGVTDDTAKRLYLYVDGQLQANDSFSGVLKQYATDYLIGSAATSGDYQRSFNGLIDEAAVFSEALTAAEVIELRDNFLPLANPDMQVHVGMNEDAWTGVSAEVKDAVGNYHGRSYGKAEIAEDSAHGRVGKFDGSDSFVSLGDVNYLDAPSYFSVVLWFKRTFDNSGTTLDSINQINNVLFAKAYSYGVDNIEIGTEGSHVEFYLNTALYNNYVSIDAGIKDNIWYHLVLTYDKDKADEVSLYLNGELLQQWSQWGGALTSCSGGIVTLGVADSVSKTGDFTGFIDDVLIYSRALSATEVQTISQLPTHYSDTDIALGTAYSYTVAVYNNDSCQWLAENATVVSQTGSLHPPAPLSALSLDTTAINLGWNDSSEYETGFELQRCDSTAVACGINDSLFAAIVSPGRNATSYTDATLFENSVYTFRVRAVNSHAPAWNTAWAYQTFTTDAKLAPDFAVSRVSEEAIRLDWSLNTTDEDGFDVERCIGNDSFCAANQHLFSTIGSYGHQDPATGYLDSSLTPDTDYTYRIRVFKNLGTANEWVTAWLTDSVSTADTHRGLTVSPLDSTRLLLSWNDSTSHETEYLIQRCTGSGCSFDGSTYETVNQNAVSYDDTGVCESTTYSYRIKAIKQGLSNGRGGTWTRKKALAINNFAAGYPLQVVIPYDADMQSDFDDIRFWDSDAEEELPYIITSRIDNTMAAVWLITGATNTVWIYYGNSLAVSSSNAGLMDTIGTNAYVEFFDNFHGTSLNSTVWNQLGATDRIVVDDNLVLSGIPAGTTSNTVISKTGINRVAGKTLFANVVPLRDPAESGYFAVGWGTNQHTNVSLLYSIYRLEWNNNSFRYGLKSAAYELSPVSYYASEYSYDMKIELLASGANYSVLGGGLNDSFKYPVWTMLKSLTTYNDTPLRVSVNNYNHDAIVDWMLVLAPPAPAPVSSFGAESAGSYTFPNPWEMVSETVEVTTPAAVAPESITAVALSQSSIQIDWTPNNPDETSLVLLHCAGDNDTCMADPNTFSAIYTAANDDTVHTYTHNGLIAGTSHTYRIEVSKSAGCSWGPISSAPVTEVTDVPPGPTGLTAVVYSSTGANLFWSESIDGETGFEVWRCEGALCNDSFVLVGIAKANAKDFRTSQGCAETTYRYKVRGINTETGQWQTAFSNISNAITTASTSTHSGLTAVWQSEGQIDISWNDSNQDETGYTVYRCEGNGCSDFTPLVSVAYNAAGSAVAHLPCNDFLDGSASDQALDASGYGNNGTSGGDAHTEPGGWSGRAAIFDGDDDYITFGDIDVLDNPESMSVSLWFNRTADNNTDNNDTNHTINNVLVAQSSDSANDNFEIGTQGTNIEIYLDTVDLDPLYASVDGGIVNGTWYHLAFVYDMNETNEAKLYLNGALLWESADAGGLIDNSTTSPISLGLARPGGSSWGDYNGLIDEVTLYAHGLTAAEIAGLYRTVHPVSWQQKTLRLAMNEKSWTGAAGEVLDSSGNDFHGTKVGNAAIVDDAQRGLVGTFDGNGDYVNVPNSAALQMTGNQTIAFWLKTGNTETRCAFNKARGGEGLITLVSNKPTYYYGTTGSSAGIIGSTIQAFAMDIPIHLGEWNHIAIVRDLGSMKLKWYRNGLKTNEVDALFATAAASSSPVTVGYGYGLAFLGQLDDFIMIDQAFSDEEIWSLYNDRPQLSPVYSDTDVYADTAYRYQVAVFNNDSACGWLSPASETVDAYTGLHSLNPLAASAVNTTVINLGWNDSVGFETGFEIQRCTGNALSCTANDSLFAAVATTGHNINQYNDSTASEGVEYTYRVRAVNNNPPAWNSGWAYDSVTAPAKAAPDFTVNRGTEEDINLSWTLNTTDEDGFIIQRCQGNDSYCQANTHLFSTIVSYGRPAPVSEYTDSGLSAKTAYTYRMQVHKNIGLENEWNTAFVYGSTDTDNYEPALAAGLVNTTEVFISWNDSTGHETDYFIQRCLDAGCSFNDSVFKALSPDTTGFEDETVCPGNTYRYRVKAVNQGLSNGQDGTWTRRKDLSVANFIAGYPLRIVVAYDDDMQSDFADLRFWDRDREIELDYVISSKIDSNDAVVWIIAGENSNSIEMYYGNSKAADSSNPALMDTIGASEYVELFDNFYGQSLDAGRWYKSAMKISQNDGLVLDGDNVNAWTNALVSYPTFAREPGMLFLARIEPRDNLQYASDTCSLGWQAGALNNTYSLGVHQLYLTASQFDIIENGSVSSPNPLRPYAPNYAYDVQVELAASGASYFTHGGNDTYPTGVPLISTASYNDPLLRVAVYNASCDAVIDWIMVFNPPDTPPVPSFSSEVSGTFSFPGEWEFVSDPVDVTTLVPAASVISAEGISQTEIVVNWTPNTVDENVFILEHCAGENAACIANDSNFETLLAFPDNSYVTNDTYTHEALAPGSAHTYRIRVEKSGYSCSWGPLLSEAVTVETLPPPGFTNVRAVSNDSLDLAKISISWESVGSLHNGIAVERCGKPLAACQDSDYVEVGTGAGYLLQFDDSSTCPGTPYNYRLVGRNEAFPINDNLSNSGGMAWSRRRPLTISSFVGSLQVKVVIPYDSDMQPDFDDLRLFNTTSETEMDYALVDKVDGVSATVWIKTAAINNPIDMYYGNANATSSSNPENVFVFWDDFNDGVIDTAKWPFKNTTGVTESGGYLRFSQNNGGYVQTSKNWAYSTLGVITAKVKTVSPPTNATFKGWTSLSYQNADASSFEGINEFSDGANNIQYRVDDATYTSANPGNNLPINQWHEVSLRKVLAYYYSYYGATTKYTDFYFESAFPTAGIFDWSLYGRMDIPYTSDYSIRLGAGKLSTASPVDGMDAMVDWVMVRNYNATTPLVAVGNEERGEFKWQTAYSYTAPVDIMSQPQPAPTNLMVTGTWDTALQLNWTDNLDDEDGYVIERCSGSGCADFAEVGSTAGNNIFADFNGAHEIKDQWMPYVTLGGNASDQYAALGYSPASLTNKYGEAETSLEFGKVALHSSSTGIDQGVCPGNLSNDSLVIPDECMNVTTRKLADTYTAAEDYGIHDRDFTAEIDFTINSGQVWNGGSGAIPFKFEMRFSSGSSHSLAFFPNISGRLITRIETSSGPVSSSYNSYQYYGAHKMKVVKSGADIAFYFWLSNQWLLLDEQTSMDATGSVLTWFGVSNAVARDGVNDIVTLLDQAQITLQTGSGYTFVDDGYLNRVVPPAWEAYGELQHSSVANDTVQISDASGSAEVYWNSSRGVLHTTSIDSNDTGYNSSYVRLKPELIGLVGNDDFDLQMDFNLPEGYDTSQSGTAYHIRLFAYFSPLWTNFAYVQLYNTGSARYYSGTTRDHGADAATSTWMRTDSFGKFRINRTGSTLTTYAWDHTANTWQILKQASFLNPDEILEHVSIRQYAHRDNDQEVLAEFSNFKLTVGDEIITVDSGLETGTPYRYRIYSYKNDNCTNYDIFTVDMLSNDSVSTPTVQPVKGDWVNKFIGTTELETLWQDTSYSETGFIVERCEGSGCDFTGNDTVLLYTEANANSLHDTNLKHSTTYNYRVRSNHDLLGWTAGYQTSPAWNNSGWTITTMSPQAPVDVVAEYGSESRIELSWNEYNVDETGFRIERSNDSCQTFSEIATVGKDAHTYSDTVVAVETNYCYRVRAYKDSLYPWNSVSNDSSIVLTEISPPVITDVSMVDSTTIELNWAVHTESHSAFEIFRCLGPVCTDLDAWISVGITANGSLTTFQDETACAGTTYSYKIRPIRVVDGDIIWKSERFSNQDSDTTLSINTPGGLVVTEVYNDSVQSGQVSLSWVYEPLDEDGFMVDRCPDTNDPCASLFVPSHAFTGPPALASWSSGTYSWERRVATPTWVTTDSLWSPITISYRIPTYATVTHSAESTTLSNTSTYFTVNTEKDIYRVQIATAATDVLKNLPFDLRVDYTLPNGFVTSYAGDVYAGFYLEFPNYDGGNTYLPDYFYIEHQGNRYYGASRSSDVTSSSTLDTSDTSGTLRITMAGRKLKAYVNSGSGWQLVHESPDLHHDLTPSLMALYNNVEDPPTTRNQTITTQFSNFTIDALRLSYRDTSVDNSTHFTYRVRPYKDAVCEYPVGPYFSNAVAETTRPFAPTNLTAEVYDGTVVKLQWTDNAPDEDGYVIEKYYSDMFVPIYSTDDSNTVYANDTRVFYTKQGNDWGKTYTYQVRAYRGDDISQPSNNDSVTLPAWQQGDSTCPPEEGE